MTLLLKHTSKYYYKNIWTVYNKSINYFFVENAGGYGPIIHTHTFPSPALKGNDIRMECIAYGS